MSTPLPPPSMSFDDNDGFYEPSFIDEDDVLPIVDTDASKWAAVHDALDPTPRIALRSSTGTLFTITWVLGLALGLTWVLRNGRTVFNQWQENVQRRANRRRHGIPDDDDRPFNVAYAAAALARRQREETEKELANARRDNSRSKPDRTQQRAAMGLRKRSSLSAGTGQPPFERETGQPWSFQGASTRPPYVPGDSSIHQTQSRPRRSTDYRTEQERDWSDPFDPSSGVSSRPSSRSNATWLPVNSSSVDPGSRRHLDVDAQDHPPAERRKHHQVDDIDDEDRTNKKSRVDGDGLIDGDNDAVWDSHIPSGSRRGSLQVPKRGSKRYANAEEDDDWEMSQDKRARKGSATHLAEEHDPDIADVEMTGGISSDADAEPARGTKREREDADSVANSAAYDTDESLRPQPARKRRAKRGEPEFKEPLSRGQKRERSSERSATGDEEESDGRPTRHKRGRPHEDAQEDDNDIVIADESESEPEIAHDPACGGRRLGETWEVNGQSFKVGLDGRRLRHALIRQSRSKFPMPKDSAHNDARANVDVIVEKWLNDDEYKAAKENYELAWQDSSLASTPEKATAPTKLEEAPPSGGKRLLWAGPPPSPIKGRASMGGRFTASVQNPFDLAPSNAGRRVASVQLLKNSPAESPKLRSAKSFSKWEKQELEASSLKKMRARMEKRKAEAAAAAAAAAPPPAPGPMPLMPSTNAQAHPTPSISFNVDTKKSAESPISMAPPAPAANPFSKPASSTPSAPTPNLSFAKPEGMLTKIAPGTDTQRPTLALPGPGSTASPTPAAPSVSKPTFSFPPTASGGPAPAPEANKGTATKPSFSFAPSSTTSSTPVALSTTKPSFTFGPAPSEPSKTAFSFGPPSSFEPSKSAALSPFTKPTSQPTPTPPATSGSTSNSPFPSFNSTSQPAQSTVSKPPLFQFSSNTSGQSNPLSSSSGGGPGSLLNRLGPASATSQPPAAQNSWSARLGGGSASTSPFASNPATSQTSSLANVFGQNRIQSQHTPSQAPSSNPFGQIQSQNASQQPSSNPFGQPQAQTPDANKPTIFGPSATSQSEAPKNIFGPPSTTSAAPAFSFPKPSEQAATGSKPATPSFSFPTSVAQSNPSSTQSKPSFSFNFGNPSTPGNANAGTSNSSSPNPFNMAPAPSLGTQAKPTGLGFGFGSSSTPAPSNPFNFGSKPAESEKK